MRRLAGLVLLLALLLAAAHAIDVQRRSTHHQQQQLASKQRSTDNPAAKAVKTVAPVTLELMRSTVPKAEAVLLSLKMRQTGASLIQAQDVPLVNEVLREKHLATYYGVIKIGDTKFRILFDTGSCEFWVPSSACETARCLHHQRYLLPADGDSSARFAETGAQDDSEDGTGAEDGEHQLNIQYLSGKVQGDMLYDTVAAGDLVVPHQMVGVASTVDIVLLDDVVWDGILGLAYPSPSLTQSGVTPFFDNVITSGALSSRGLANQLAYYIDDEKGSVTFGGVNCALIRQEGSACIDSFKFVPVVDKSYWTILLRDVRVEWPGREPLSGFCGSDGCQAIVDTGTYLLYGPADQVGQMLRSESDTVSCAQHGAMPTFTFVLAGADGQSDVELSLRPIDYILKFDDSGHEECVVGIAPDQDTIWTLGQVFLRTYYALFDRDADRVGFAHVPRTTFQAITSGKPPELFR